MISELLVILLLILANGLFAMAEIAVLSARRVRLLRRADKGDAGARAALSLGESPDRFLSTVQTGITLVGMLTGVVSGATIARELGAWLDDVPGIAPYGEALGVSAVVLAVSYLTLVLGELVPKRIGLAHAEAIAARAAPPLKALERLAAPLVGFLAVSTSAVAQLLGVRGGRDESVTEEEVRHLIARGTDEGLFEPAEQRMAGRVLRFGDRQIGSLMTPRKDVVWLDTDDAPDAIRAKLAVHPQSRFPVAEGDLDHIVGLAAAHDLVTQVFEGKPPDVRAAACPPLYLPESQPALAALRQMRERRQQLAFVVDEYGTFQGVLSVADLMAAVVDPAPADTAEEPAIVRREDGSYLVDGGLALEALRELLPVDELPAEGAQTLGGLVMGVLQRVPSAGDQFEAGGFRFEVVDMDELRVDKVLIAPAGT